MCIKVRPQALLCMLCIYTSGLIGDIVKVAECLAVPEALKCVIDCCAGDGTAAIFENDPSVFTFSMHCDAQSFPSPLHKSDEDVALPAGTTDEMYLEVSGRLYSSELLWLLIVVLLAHLWHHPLLLHLQH